MKTPPQPSINAAGRDYPAGELVRRLLGVAWHYRADFLLSLGLSLMLLLLGLLGLQLLGVVIDVIRHALDPSQRAPAYPFGWMPPADWPALRIVTVLVAGHHRAGVAPGRADLLLTISPRRA